MVARKMSSAQTIVAKSHLATASRHSRIDRFLLQQLAKLQLQRRITTPQALIPRYVRRSAQQVLDQTDNLMSRMDLYQDDNLPSSYALIELPGINEECLRVDVSNDLLTVEGVRGPPLRSRLNEILRARARTNESHNIPKFTLADEKYLGRELNFGIFRRKIQLPAGTKVRLNILHYYDVALRLMLFSH